MHCIWSSSHDFLLMRSRALIAVAWASSTAALLQHAALPRSTSPALSRATPLVSVAAVPDAAPRVVEEFSDFDSLPGLSGLNGKAMLVEKSDIPTKAQVRAALPPHVLTRDTKKSLMYAAISVAQSAACLGLGFLIPLKAAFLPLWVAWAAVTGTVWTGMWVVAHECGHAAFSDNRLIQDTVGYILHTLLLVPYFSWQHSHAVHHAHTNHITKGETHVPHVVGGRDGIENPGGERELAAARVVGKGPYGALQMFLHLVVGWPAYLLWGATGGPKYGTSNHFVPRWPFNAALWPGKWAKKVLQSDIGIVGMCAALFGLSMKFGALAVFALYGAPLIFTNMWLVGYTWLQHTDVDIPHLTDKEFSYMRGAFLTVDRPYGPIFDWFHHRIGSTHVAHHIDCTIPHYYAKEATEAIKANFPKAYLYDDTPVHKALWRVATNCLAVKLRPKDGRYTWVPV